jgi:hypothetical protein
MHLSLQSWVPSFPTIRLDPFLTCSPHPRQTTDFIAVRGNSHCHGPTWNSSHPPNHRATHSVRVIVPHWHFVIVAAVWVVIVGTPSLVYLDSMLSAY